LRRFWIYDVLLFLTSQYMYICTPYVGLFWYVLTGKNAKKKFVYALDNNDVTSG